ncbi:ComEC/Rec2-like protein [Nitritalea halalkaliphila LW7]|uniref:ComEC/Rec2-like protein n=1 Tax=Nitritalea halalkaliphila LW7 TaxID=1189621 RepID=I5BYB6_9BACT|nr:ComEC/Rec2-like protein [Nitritalea halalkaliphila LW7]
MVGLIWLYAGLTGGSPSVQRSALMFSLMALSKVGRRPQKGVHAVFLSALLLLAWQPSLLFSLGFQLSYAAVLGILYVQPLLTRLWAAPPAYLRPLWELTCVSVAAQIGTYPLTAAYFHVFPTYFLLTNVIVIPGAFVIMGLGLPLLLFSWWEGLAKLLAYVLQRVIQLFNYMVFQIEALPYAQLDHLFLSPLQQVLYVGALLLILQLLGKLRKRSVLLACFVAFLWPVGQCLDLLLRTRERPVSESLQEQRWQVREGEAWGYWQQGRFWLYAWALPAEEQRFAVHPWLVRQAFPVARGQLLEREGQLYSLLPSGQLKPLEKPEEAQGHVQRDEKLP